MRIDEITQIEINRDQNTESGINSYTDYDNYDLVGDFRGIKVYTYQKGTARVYLGRHQNFKSNVFIVNLYHIASPNVFQVGLTSVKPKFQGFKFMPEVYAFIMKNQNIIIQSGPAQSQGGQQIWNKLTEIPGIQVFAREKESSEIFELEYDSESGDLYNAALDQMNIDLYDSSGKNYSIYAAAS